MKKISNGILSISLIILFLFLFHSYFIFTFSTKGESMMGGIEDGDVIQSVKYHFLPKEINRGNIVYITKEIEGKNTNVIKRVVGLPGEHVQIILNRVYINGKEIKESYLYEPMIQLGGVDIWLKAGEYFVMGDNRNISLDSRQYGAVQEDEIKAIALFKVEVDGFSAIR